MLGDERRATAEAAALADAAEHGADGRERAPRSGKRRSSGFYISGHPLEPVPHGMRAVRHATRCRSWARGATRPMTLGVRGDGHQATGQQAKSGAEFARLTVEDFSGSSEVLVFPEAWGVDRRPGPDRRPGAAQGRVLPARPGGGKSDVHRRVASRGSRRCGSRGRSAVAIELGDGTGVGSASSCRADAHGDVRSRRRIPSGLGPARSPLE